MRIVIKRTLIALFAHLIILPIAVHGQSDRSRLSEKQIAKIESLISQLEQLNTQVDSNPSVQSARVSLDPRLDEIALERMNDRSLAARAIELLKVLESNVITYDSLADFQESGKLARVPFEVFQQNLEKVSAEAAVILSWLPQSRLKSEINNALLSYQDGGFWWKKTYAPRVVNVAHFAPEARHTTADTNYLSTVPYTIAINWRHGSRYTKRAEKIFERYHEQEQSKIR